VVDQRSDGFYHLSCTDDGPGFAEGLGSETGLGMRILIAAAQQLGGELLIPDRDTGVEIEVVWPIKD